jgi:hypothetical protein
MKRARYTIVGPARGRAGVGGEDDGARAENRVAAQADADSDERCIERTTLWGGGVVHDNLSALFRQYCGSVRQFALSFFAP